MYRTAKRQMPPATTPSAMIQAQPRSGDAFARSTKPPASTIQYRMAATVRALRMPSRARRKGAVFRRRLTASPNPAL
jgi:hypothetical protein